MRNLKRQKQLRLRKPLKPNSLRKTPIPMENPKKIPLLIPIIQKWR